MSEGKAKGARKKNTGAKKDVGTGKDVGTKQEVGTKKVKKPEKKRGVSKAQGNEKKPKVIVVEEPKEQASAEEWAPKKTKKKTEKKSGKKTEKKPGKRGSERGKWYFWLGRAAFVIAIMIMVFLSGLLVGKAVGAIVYPEPDLSIPEQEIDASGSRAEQIAEAAQTEVAELVKYEKWVAMGRKLVALTFDDGPSGVTTPRLLDILKEKKVKATFFILGSMAQYVPEVVKREEAEGHEVGSHTTGHLNLSYMKNAAEMQAEVAAMGQIFTDILGRTPRIMRPPYGNGIDNPVVTQNIGVPMIHWSVDTLDWKSRNAAKVREAVNVGVFDGAIILMHDIHPTTVDAVSAIIDDLRAKGYEFVTVSELAKARGVGMQAGVAYYSFKP